MNKKFKSLSLIALLLVSTSCANLFKRGEPTRNAETTIRLGAAAWHQYVNLEKTRCRKDTACLERLGERDAKAKEVLRVAGGHVQDLALAIKVGNKAKAREYISALEALVQGMDPEHFRDTFNVMGSLRDRVDEME